MLRPSDPDPLPDHVPPPTSQAAIPLAACRLAAVRARAAAWVAAASSLPPAARDTPPHVGRPAGPPDHYGVCPVLSLNTAVLPDFFPSLPAAGVTLFEPFGGGMLAGLEMLLRHGVVVARYLYADISPAAHTIARFRLAALSATYPSQLPPAAWSDAFTALPQDVRLVHTAELLRAGALNDTQWVVVGGWSCQDLSSAGKCAGLWGPTSHTFFDALRLVGTLQQLQPYRPPAYLLENVAFQLNFRDAVVRDQFRFVCDSIGTPVTFDAAQVGSHAHRLRNYWTNLADPAALQQILAAVVPPPLLVGDILDPGRVARPVTRDDMPPYYPSNHGSPLHPTERCVLPTLVASVDSYAFRGNGAGMVWDSHLNSWTQPNPDEREAALGYPRGCTAAPGVTAAQRHTATGNSMDAHALEAIFSVAAALAPAAVPSARLWGVGTAAVTAGSSASPHAQLLQSAHQASLAALADQMEGNSPTHDVWNDANTLGFVLHQTLPPDLPAAERARVQRRALSYCSNAAGGLCRIMNNGTKLLVPAPAHREQLITMVHQQYGHFGIRRTVDLLQASHWWYGLQAQVGSVLAQCSHCDRANQTIHAQNPTLSPLPVMGPFYRWGVDLFGPLPPTSQGHTYCMVAIEYFTKHVEVIPLPCKEASVTADAFATIIGRFGAPAEVVTDQGTEFKGEFETLLTTCFIDHRRTSPNHPQGDGLAERCVQTIKSAIRKVASETGDQANWDKALPWILLGYRCSRQAASGFSPYFLLYAATPVLPPAAKERLDPPLTFENPATRAAAVTELLDRAMVMKTSCAMAHDNLLIAQQRDTLRYATVRSGGGYQPTLRTFTVGQLVYLKLHNLPSTLDMRARAEIYRVIEVRPSGVLLLGGRDGRTFTQHGTNCLPCHLPNVDLTLTPALARPDKGLACQTCRFTDGEAYMLLCDTCNDGYHIYCLDPPLLGIPEGSWTCPRCHPHHNADAPIAPAPQASPRAARRVHFTGDPLRRSVRHVAPAAAMQDPYVAGRAARNAAVDGRPVEDRRAAAPRVGVVKYLGEGAGPRCFVIQWATGEASSPMAFTALKSLL